MSRWVPSWRCVPIDYGCEIASFENITQTCWLTNNLRGRALRVRFDNLCGADRLIVDHASVSACSRATGRLSAPVPVTRDGRETIVIEPGAQPYSDEIPLSVEPEDDLCVRLYFRQRTAVRALCTTASARSWQCVLQTGDFRETEALGFADKARIAPVLAAEPYPLQFAAGLCEVSVQTAEDVQLVGLFGDSLTHMGYYSDALIEELCRRAPGKYSVFNAGISGNRIAKPYPVAEALPGGGRQFGAAGKERFLRDLYDGASPDVVFLLEGVNDCSHGLAFGEPDVPEASDIAAALAGVIAQAHAHGSRVLLGTIPPFGAFGEAWRDRAEELRCRTNELIRAGLGADRTVDLDAALRDPGDPHRMRANLHLGDGVHPNAKGGRVIAKSILRELL